MNDTKKPIWKDSREGVQILLWNNTSKEGREWTSAVLERSWKDKQGNWNSQRIYLSEKQCLAAADTLINAARHMRELRQEDTEEVIQEVTIEDLQNQKLEL